jgi:hypothetical protein
MTSFSFNLVRDPWLRALMRTGGVQEFALPDVFRHAGEIHSLAYANPMDRYSVFRFLLALLYWAEGNPPPGSAPDAAEVLKRVAQHIEDNPQHFELFGPEPRFYQLPPLKGSKSVDVIGRLFHEIPTGTNIAHLRHVWAEPVGICAACCALGLLRLPNFTTMGGSGYSPGLAGAPPLRRLPWGSTLAQTLLSNWQRADNLGEPAWVAPEPEIEGEIPLLVGLTWLPRRVWLCDPEQGEERCSLCARKAPLVKRCHYEPGKKQSAAGWTEAHTVYDRNKKVVYAGEPLGNSETASSAWRWIFDAPPAEQCAAVEGEMPSAGQPAERAWLIALASNQAKYLHLIDGLLPRGVAVAELAAKLQKAVGANSLLRPRNFLLIHPLIRVSDKQRKDMPAPLTAYVKRVVLPARDEKVSNEAAAGAIPATAEHILERLRIHSIALLSAWPGPYGPAWPRLNRAWHRKLHWSFLEDRASQQKGGKL